MRVWGKKSAPKRNEYCSIFSPSNWNDLSGKSKTEHTVFCNECPKLNGHGMFPSSCNRFKENRKADLAYGLKEVKKTIKKSPKSEISKSVKEALKVLNSSFGNTHGVNFEEALIKNSNFQKGL